ncbi:MAG: ABC transporter substrate-binding protein [Bacteroidota bacterium]
MKKLLYVLAVLLIASMILTACGGAAPAPTQAPAATEAPSQATEAPAATAAPTEAATQAPAATEAPAATPTLTPYPIAECQAGKTCVRWFIGLGTGTDPVQLDAEQSVVDDFNASQDKIQLIMEVVPYASAKDTLSTEIASGNAPDVIGPVGWSGSNAYYGQWLDLAPYIQKSGFDTSVFNPALVKMYETSEGQVGLPFAVYPSAIFFNAKLFDEAGLNYPPANYGDKYKMPDGSEVEWNWDTLTKVGKLLTVDANGKNATEDGFDKNNIVQYGYTFNFENHPAYVGSFLSNGGSMVAADGKTAQAPENWQKAWKWFYEGIWGDQPFIPNGQVEASADFGAGNAFNSDKVAMVDAPAWYTCCMGNVKTWEAAAMPVGLDGKVAGRVDADTFRVLKSTKNPEAAFEVVSYLVTDGVQKLIIGSADNPPAYGAVPARTADGPTWLEAKKAQFPWVKNWQTILDGLNYPDVPSAESYMPNYNEAWQRGATFFTLMQNTGGLDIQKEIDTYVSDLQTIFNKK